MKNTTLVLAALGVSVILTACGHSGSDPQAVARASTWAAQFKNNPQLRTSTQAGINQIEVCARTAKYKGEALNITAAIPMPDSTTKPSVSGLTFKDLKHTIQVSETIFRCTPEGKKHGHKFKKCFENILQKDGISGGVKATLGRWFQDVAGTCMKAKPTS